MKNCFGYVRVSSHKQGEGVSLEAQKDAILRFAATSGIEISEWHEEQQTAAKSGRPVFNTMMKALKAGRAEGVVMHKIDRSARNFFDWARIGELADSGIDVHFATESLDFRSRGGRLTANIQMAVAEDYVRNLKAEIHKGQRGQLQRGHYPFKAPIGYLDNGGNQLKTPDPVRGPLMRTAFELYASGQYSLRSLRHELASRGLTRASGEPLSKGCLEKFLSNPFYTGLIRIRRTGETYQGAHEPLISTALFQRVAEVRAGKEHKKITRHNHLFRGLFRCGRCDRSMIAELQKGHVYYRCQAPTCRGNSVREELLSGRIAATLAAVRIRESDIATIHARVEHWCRQTSKSQKLDSYALALQRIDQRLERLEDAAIDRIIDAGSFAKRKEKLMLERAAHVEAVEKSARKKTDPDQVARFLERTKNLAEHYDFAEPTEKREIAEIATSNRTVTAKNVAVEPADWLETTRQSVAVLCCAERRPTSRTSPELQGPHLASHPSEDRPRDDDISVAACHWIERLIELVHAPDAKRIEQLFQEGYNRQAFGADNYQDNDLRL